MLEAGRREFDVGFTRRSTGVRVDVRLVEADALANQAFAVIDEQPQIEFGPVQVGGRERVQALLERSASDVERIDRIRLAALAGTAASVRGQVSREPQHPLAAATAAIVCERL